MSNIHGLNIHGSNIHQHSLCPTSAELRDTIIEHAAFFPFFDLSGDVRAYMLVWQDSPLIVMLDSAMGLITKAQPLILNVREKQLKDPRENRFGRDKDLFHFDPWWLLAEKRYTGHAAVPMLKATNVAPALGQMQHPGWFTPSLDQVVGDLQPFLGEQAATKRGWQRKTTTWSPRATWPGLSSG